MNDEHELLSQAAALDTLLRSTLKEFAAHLDAVPWHGKEHDCVNRFAHGFLIPRCQAGSALSHATQVGIEIGVAQPPAFRTRPTARKDLVIWPHPWMSSWDSKWNPVNHPLVVMEWKAIRVGVPFRGSQRDREWLSAFARWKPSCLGYSVVVSAGDSPRQRLAVSRFQSTEVDDGWLIVERANI